MNDYRQSRVNASDSGHDCVLGDSPGLAEKLREIQSITDAALSRLTPQDLLDVLVDRVRLALQADTAAVLLLDASSGFLIATAASGLEEEVNQGVRIPVGMGFAGRIAAEGQPIVLDEVDHSKVVNPLLLDKQIRSLMGAPLRSEGSVLDVLHVGTLKPRDFSPEDVNLLQLAADRAALAVEALNAQTDRVSTIALQRSLQPSALPAVAGLQNGLSVCPWQRQRRRRLVGRLRAAARSGLRGRRRRGRQWPQGRGDHGPDAERAARLRAGDLRSGGQPAGALLCLYTDGLVERRGWPIDDGIEHLCKAIKDSEPEACCAAAMAALANLRPPADDIALLVIRRVQQAPGEPVIADQAVRRPKPLAAPVRWSGRHAVVTMPAEIDVTKAGELYDLLASVAAQSPEVVTVDMTGNAFCDSAGLNSLIRARRLLMRDNHQLRVALGDSPSRRITDPAPRLAVVAAMIDSAADGPLTLPALVNVKLRSEGETDVR